MSIENILKLNVSEEQFKNIMINEVINLEVKLDVMTKIMLNPDYKKDDTQALIDPVKEMANRIRLFNDEIKQNKIDRIMIMAKTYGLDVQPLD